MKKSTLLAGILAALAAAPLATAQNFYQVQKTALYLQTSAAGPVAWPYYPYGFVARTPVATSLVFPGGATLPLVSNPDAGDYEINEFFATKAALDAAYPNGTYHMTGSGLPQLTFLLTQDAYPSAIPAVTNGTWRGGVLVVDPAVATSIEFSDFTTYATGGVGGHLGIEIDDYSMRTNGSDQVVKNDTISKQNPLFPYQAAPATSCVIPARSLNPGDICEAQLQFDTALTFNTSTLDGSGFGSLYENLLDFFIVAKPSGSPPPQPVISTDLADQTAVIGGTATLAPRVTVGGAPITGNYAVVWYCNGLSMARGGNGYLPNMSPNGTSLVINPVTAFDGGVYFARFINAGGLATTATATLAVVSGTAPAITTQPASQTVSAGGTASFSVAASGTPPPSYRWRESTNGGTNWEDVPPGGSFSGQATRKLTVANAPTSMSGDLFRCVATNAVKSATSAIARLTVNKLAQTVNFPQPANKVYGDPPFVVAATASSGLPVSLMIDSGPATFSGGKVVLTGVGKVTLTAFQAGNATYAAGAGPTRSFTVAKAAQTITFSALPNKTSNAAPFSLSASASSGLPVTFTVVSGPAKISGKTVTLTGTGTVEIRASQAGNADYNAALSVSRSFTVTK
jgi:hypothetical protein